MTFSQRELEAKTRAAAIACVSCYSLEYVKEHKIMDRELKARGIKKPESVAAIADRMLTEQSAIAARRPDHTGPNARMSRIWTF